MSASTNFDFGENNPRAVRARLSHVPCLSWRHRMAHNNERLIAEWVRGKLGKMFEAFDVLVPSHHIGIEVKTVITAKVRHRGVRVDKCNASTDGTVQIHVRKECRERKLKHAEMLGLRKLFTVVVDERECVDGYGQRRFFVKAGVGSFRLGSMTEVKNRNELCQIIGIGIKKAKESKSDTKIAVAAHSVARPLFRPDG